MMCASFGSDACDARLVEALSLEIASLRQSRLRVAAAVRKLRHEHETFPSPTTITTTIDEASDADIIATAAVTLAWMGKADRGRWLENRRSGRRRVGGLGRRRAVPDGTAVTPARRHRLAAPLQHQCPPRLAGVLDRLQPAERAKD